MATIVGHLQARLSATSAAFAEDMKKASNSAKGFGGSMKGLGVQALAAGAGFGLVTSAVSTMQNAVSSAAHAIIDLVANQIQTIDAASEVAARLGITTDALMSFHFAAKMANVEATTFNASITKMTKTIATAATKGKGLDGLFSIEQVKELSGMAIDKQFEAIAEAISKVENPALRAKLAMDVFGKSGGQLIPILAGGAAGIQDMVDEYHRLHGAVTEEEVAQIKEAADAMDALSTAWAGFGTQLAVSVSPALTEALDLFTDFIREIKEMNALEIAAGGAWKALFTAASDDDVAEKAKRDARKSAAPAGSPLGEIDDASAAAAAQKAAESREKSIEKVIEKLQRERDEYGKTTAEILVQEMIRKGATMVQIAQALALQMHTSEMEKAAAETKRQKESTDQIVESLERERDLYGKSAAESAEYELRKAGATDAAIEHARAIAEETDAMKAQADAAEQAKRDQEQQAKELERAGQAVVEATRTPFEKFDEEMKRLAELRDKGAIDMETFGRAAEQAREGLDSATKPADEAAPVGGVAAAELGSSAAASIIARSLNTPGGEAQQPDQRVAKNTDELRKLATKNNFNLEKLIVNTQPLADLVEVNF